MPNIFGKVQSDYAHLAAAGDDDSMFARQRGVLTALNGSEVAVRREPFQDGFPLSNWDLTFGGSNRSQVQLADDGFDILSWWQSNYEAIQQEYLDVLYRDPRPLESYCAVLSTYSYGDEHGGFPVRDHAGDAEFLTEYGENAPVVGVSQRIETFPILRYGNNIKESAYRRTVVSQAQSGIMSLDPALIRASVDTCIRFREKVLLEGSPAFGPGWDKGLLNQVQTSDDDSFTDDNGNPTIYLHNFDKNLDGVGGTNQYTDGDALSDAVNKVIDLYIQRTKAALPRSLSGPMTLVLPRNIAGPLIWTRIGDSDMTLWQYLSMNNMWTKETMMPLQLLMPDSDFMDTAANGRAMGALWITEEDAICIEETQAPMAGTPGMSIDSETYVIPTRAAISPVIIKQPAALMYLGVHTQS